jgi:hypothetical protein
MILFRKDGCRGVILEVYPRSQQNEENGEAVRVNCVQRREDRIVIDRFDNGTQKILPDDWVVPRQS